MSNHIQIQRITLTATLLLATITLAGESTQWPIVIHGTFSQGYIDSEDNNYIEDSEDGTFDFREYGLNANWQICNQVQIGAQVFVREYGTVGNDEPYLDWAYLDYRPMDEFGVRVGRMKLPNGLYNDTREIDALRTEILLPSGVYMELAREMMNGVNGLGLYGDLELEAAGTVSYYFLFGERSADEDDGDFARLLDTTHIDIDDYDMEESYSGKLEWDTPLHGLTLAATYSVEDLAIGGTQDLGAFAGAPGLFPPSPIAIDIKDLEAWVFSAEYTIGKLTLATEASRVTHDTTATTFPYPTEDASGEFEGYYVKAGYEWSDLFKSVVGFTSTDDTLKDETSDDIYLSLRFDITPNLILKLEEHYIDGTAGLFSSENSDGIEDDMTMFLAKATLYF